MPADFKRASKRHSGIAGFPLEACGNDGSRDSVALQKKNVMPADFKRASKKHSGIAGYPLEACGNDGRRLSKGVRGSGLVL